MKVPIWAAELARTFWARAGQPEPFPRRLRRPIANALPLAVIDLPGATVNAVFQQLHKDRIPCDLKAKDRPLRACIVARNGHGLAFIDATDPDDEQRFSLAHELAHFLRDYWYQRWQTMKRLGTAALEVLDGIRRPTDQERLLATLKHTQIDFYFHLMDRRSARNPRQNAIIEAEESADRLAYELLAPAADVLSVVALKSGGSGRSAVVHTLMSYFGLPEQHADIYAGLLLPTTKHIDPLLLRLRNVS